MMFDGSSMILCNGRVLKCVTTMFTAYSLSH